MSIQLIQPTPSQIPQLARIFFEAFKGISDAHNFPYDITDVETSALLMGMLVTRPDFYGVVAVESAAPETVLGFNFVQISDPVGGVGPLCVDPSRQARGLGKLLMRHIVEWSLQHHGPMVRLLQESFNMASLSLYTALGYTVTEPIVLTTVVPAAAADASVRPLTQGDVEACDDLCRSVYRVSRKTELALAIEHGPAMGCISHGRFIKGKVTASVIPGFFGFCVGASPEDLLVAVEQTARACPPPLHRILIPATNGDLFRGALLRGFKSIKMLNVMAIGPYEAPLGAWTPSIAY